jgi:hypothetical protein
MRNAIALTIVLFIGTTAWGVEICHVPPGNSGNPRTIDINENAVGIHIGPNSNHPGDYLGACTPADLSIADLSNLLVVNSAAGKGSNSLVELVDNSDADAGGTLGLN